VVTVLAMAMLSFPCPVQDRQPEAQDRRPGAEEVLKKHRGDLEKMDGVVSVTAGGTEEDVRIVVRVSSKEAREEVRKKLGETLGGYKVFVYVASRVGQTSSDPGRTTGPTRERTQRVTEPTPSFEDCDIIRDYLKLKPVTRHEDGKTIPGCQLIHRQRIGGGGGHTFWFTRHRTDCPIRTNRLKEPEDMDEFVKWVFTQGFQPAQRRSFLLFELKGSDKMWFEQVKQDLTALLPYIREGAVWVKADEKKGGIGWKWEIPRSREPGK